MVDSFPDISAIEEQLQSAPTSKQLLEQFLSAALTPTLITDPRRIEHIVTYVRLYPRSYFSRCPFVSIHPERAAEGFRRVELEWLAHLHRDPSDAEIARGLALLVAESDPLRALGILHSVETANPHNAELYVDMGRIPQPPAGRLAAFRRARELGATQPNLLVWIAGSALDAGDLETAEQAGQELLALVAEARAMWGEQLDFPERGRELWAKASVQFSPRSAARELTSAISDHANRKHWGHTVLGVIAVRRGDIDLATRHLAASASIVGEPRVSSYGPSFRLARELVAHGQWEAVESFIAACRAFWNGVEMDTWIDDLKARKTPEFWDQ